MLLAGCILAYCTIGLLTGPYFVYRYNRHCTGCTSRICWCDSGSDLRDMVEFSSYLSATTWPLNAVFVFLITPLFCYVLAPTLTKAIPFTFGWLFSAIRRIYGSAEERGVKDGKAIIERRVKDQELKAQEEKLEAEALAKRQEEGPCFDSECDRRVDEVIKKADEILRKAGNYEEEIS